MLRREDTEGSVSDVLMFNDTLYCGEKKLVTLQFNGVMLGDINMSLSAQRFFNI